jgi:predicted transcriptional regulator
MIIMDLVEFVKYKRRYYGHKQQDLADMSGVGLHFIRNMEQGKKSLQLGKVNQVLAVYKAEMAPIAIHLNQGRTTKGLPKKFKDLHPWT